jgi:uncharacterized protein (TIGR03066 family)
MRAISGCIALLLVAAVVLADDKTEKVDVKKLIGKWEPTGKDNGKGTVEFTKDGKVVFTANDPKDAPPPGTMMTYSVDGNKITITITIKGSKDIKRVLTVSKFTDTEFTAKDDMGEEGTMTRVKDK